MSGFESHMDHLMEMAEYLVERLEMEKDKFYLVLKPEMVNVSFWYIPKRLRGMPHNQHRINELGKVRAYQLFVSLYSRRVEGKI